jgi:MFS family permease
MSAPDTILRNTLTLSNIFSSLRARNYRLFFIGQGISLIGTWMQNIALSWLVYRLTGSVFLLGLIAFSSEIPNFILAPFTGVLTDRLNRHRLMILAQIFFLLQSLSIALLVLLDHIAVWHIFTLSTLFGIISAFEAPARQSLVVDLIDKPEDLGNAVALNSALYNGARLIGPAIAGITIALVGEGICFLINTVSFVAVILALTRIRIPKRSRLPRTTNLRESFREGLQYTFHSVPIRTLLLILAALSLTGLPFIVLLPAYAREILQGQSDTLGFLMSALGAGALIGSIYLAARKTVLGLGEIISIFTVLLGITIILASFTKVLSLSLLFFFFAGLSMILVIAAVNTLLHTLTDEDKRGRVMSFYAMALMGTIPIGNLLAGSIAGTMGIPGTLLAGGITTIGAGIWFETKRKKLRKHIHPIYINKGIMSPAKEYIA